MTLRMPQRSPQGSPQGSPLGSHRTEPQGLPQGKPLPYSLYLYLYLLPYGSNSPSSVAHQGAAPVVAPSPVVSPDAMMSLRQIEHLDFEPSCDVPGCERPAGIVVEVLAHLTHIAKSARAGRRHTPCLPCWSRPATTSPGCAP